MLTSRMHWNLIVSKILEVDSCAFPAQENLRYFFASPDFAMFETFLGGGFKYFLFSSLLGEDSKFD